MGKSVLPNIDPPVVQISSCREKRHSLKAKSLGHIDSASVTGRGTGIMTMPLIAARAQAEATGNMTTIKAGANKGSLVSG